MRPTAWARESIGGRVVARRSIAVGVVAALTVVCWTAAMILFGWLLADGRRDDERHSRVTSPGAADEARKPSRR
jgi:type VI protein secretion system component VasF